MAAFCEFQKLIRIFARLDYKNSSDMDLQYLVVVVHMSKVFLNLLGKSSSNFL